MPTTTTTGADESAAPKHPEYDAIRELWDQMRYTSAGEHAVKAAGTAYLPKTSGQVSDLVFGEDAYDAYKLRSVYYEFLRDTQRDMIGLLTKEPTVYKVPTKLEPYLLKASSDGETVHGLQRRVFDEQLVPSRVGLLLEVPADEGLDTMPVSVLYSAERVLNWDDDNSPPRWILLDESRDVLTPGSLNRTLKKQSLLLALDGKDEYYTYRFNSWPEGFDMLDPGDPTDIDDKDEDGALTYPELIGKRMTDVIPFTFINATHTTPSVELPALLSLSNLSLSLYRGEADYRQTLFMQGQETLLLIGFTEKEREGLNMGASSYIATMTSKNEADAKFIGISAEGLEESRESQTGLKTECKNLGIELVENGAESGTALNTRLTVRTASLSDIARVCAAGIEEQLKYAGKWLALSESDLEAIEVNAATDFTDSTALPKEMLDLWAAVQQGGMTLEDYHAWLSENDFTDMPLDEWLDKVQATGGLVFGSGTTTDDVNDEQ